MTAAAIDRNTCGWLDVLARQPGAERRDGWVITDVPFSLCNSVVMPCWGEEEADARIDEILAAGRERGVPQLWWTGRTCTPVDVVERLEARGVVSDVEPMPGMAELVTWAAEHYEVGLLSNNMPGFIDVLRHNGIIPNADYKAIVDSSKVGAVKPEAKIYEVAQQLAAVGPDEILFIDDSRTNLIVADKLSWHVLWFDDYHPAESIEKIKESLSF